MTRILDHSVWAVRPEVLATLQQLASGGVGDADLRRLLDDPQAAEARIRRSQVDSEDLPRVGSVAVLSLTGLIQPNPSLLSMLLFGAGGGLQQFRAELRAALADETITAIALHVDSPGGSIALVEETAAELRAARDVKPITAVANTMAASAAYHIASQATELVVTPSGYVGSIGVYMLHTDLSGALEKEGVVMTYVYAGRYKTEGNPYEPLTDEARADWQSDVDGLHDTFVRDVAAGRQVPEAKVRSDFGEGRLLRAADALQAGMVNRVATFEQAVGDLARAAQAPDPVPSPPDAAATHDPASAQDPADAPDDVPEEPRLTARDDFDALAI